MRRILVRCLPLCAALCTACQAGAKSDEEAFREAHITDLFVPEGEPLHLAKEPVIVVGLEESLPLDRVEGAVFFRDGIAIANSGSSEILILDSVGRLRSRQGRRGDGPGDYKYLAGVVRHNDGLVAWDAYHSRVSLLDSLGRYLSQTKIPARAGKSIVGAFGNSVLVQFVVRGFPGEGDLGPLESRLDVAFEIVRLSDGVVAFETTLPGEEQWAQRKLGENGWSTHGGLPVIFGRKALSAVTERGVYLATTDSLTLTEYDETGSGVGISFHKDQVVAETEWEQFVRDSTRAYIKARGSQGSARRADGRTFLEVFAEFDLDLLEHLPARPTLPSFSDMKGSSDGRLWIREYPNPMQDRVAWIAFNGIWEREEIVEMPVALRVLDISDNSVLVLAKGEFGEDLVEVYLIER